MTLKKKCNIQRRQKEVLLGGSKVVIFACEMLGLCPHLIEVNKSLVPFEGATAVWSKETVENVHNGRFLRLF